MKNVTIYTDGACSGNPGPGGWGAILQYGAATRELSGSEPSTTNNRMELLGVITALEMLKEPLCRGRHHEGLGEGLACARLGQERQEAGEKPRAVGTAARPARPPRGPLPLGQGSRRQPVQQPLR